MARVTEFERTLMKFGMEWFDQARDVGRAELLCILAGKRFDGDVDEELADLLGDPPDPDRLLFAEAGILVFRTAEKLLGHVRKASDP